jgi:hypothetical protein
VCKVEFCPCWRERVHGASCISWWLRSSSIRTSSWRPLLAGEKNPFRTAPVVCRIWNLYLDLSLRAALVVLSYWGKRAQLRYRFGGVRNVPAAAHGQHCEAIVPSKSGCYLHHHSCRGFNEEMICSVQSDCNARSVHWVGNVLGMSRRLSARSCP